MSESIIFCCDFCGQRSEEEPASWPRSKRGRVELVLPEQRFHVAPRTVEPVLYEGAPAFPGMSLPLPSFPGPVGAAFPPAAFPMPMPSALSPEPIAASEEEDENRWVATLCDQCMRRIAGLFDLKLETHEEALARSAREAESRSRSHAQMRPDPGVLSSLKGEMVAQYPTRPPHSEPGPGGLVEQFPTPKPYVPGAADPSAPIESQGRPVAEPGKDFRPMTPDDGPKSPSPEKK
jgi:hypothetical protein